MGIKRDKYVFLRDTSPGNHKIFTVPAGRVWSIDWLHVRFRSNALPGSRLLSMRLMLPSEPGKPLARFISPVYQHVGSVWRYQFLPGILEAPTRVHAGNIVYLPIPDQFVLNEGWEIHIEDMNDTDPDDHIEVRSLVALQEK